MTIQLMPEDEEIVQERLRSGAFGSVQEVIHHALRVQDAEESWLALHKREVGERLERAMEEFDQGGGIPASQVRPRLLEECDRPPGLSMASAEDVPAVHERTKELYA